MERIQVDFAMQRGHEMIIQREPPFARADLDEVDMQMLQAERPPGLLPVDWFEMDGSVTFRYAIDGRKLLPHRLITGSFGMQEYISLMLGVVEALDSCGHYLLRESCCLLDEKFLFVGGDWRDAALTYVPLREPLLKKPAREELLGLAVRLMGKTERVNGAVVQAVLRLLDDPAASWSNIRVGLLQLLASEQGGGAGTPNVEGARSHRSASDAAHPDAGGQQAHGSRNADVRRLDAELEQRSVQMPGSSPAGEPGGEYGAADGGGQPDGPAKSRFDLLGRIMGREEPADTPPPETSMFDDREWPGTTGRIRDAGRARWLSACGAILAAALIWRYIYLPSPGTDRLLISLGATLLTAGGLFLLWQRLEARRREPLDDPSSAGGSGIGGMDDGRPDVQSGGPSDADGIRTDAAELRFPWLVEFGLESRPATDSASAARADSFGADADKGAGRSFKSAYVKADMEITAVGTADAAGLAGVPGTAASVGLPGAPGISEAFDRPDIPGMSGIAGTSGVSGMAGAAGSAAEETGVLADETVLLHGRDRQDGPFWLVREHEGQYRRIPVEPGVAVIGRSEAHARIVDTAEGVSRAHLEIACDGAEVRIKDLASRNGTLLGGEIMVPYKEYALQDGDAFRLAGPDGPKYTLRRGG